MSVTVTSVRDAESPGVEYRGGGRRTSDRAADACTRKANAPGEGRGRSPGRLPTRSPPLLPTLKPPATPPMLPPPAAT